MKIEKLSAKQRQIFRFIERPENYLICDGAVRSGKTVCMGMAFFIWAMEHYDRTNFAVCSKTVSNAERNVVSPLLTVENLPYVFKYSRSERKLTVRCGTRENWFYLFGGKDESSYMLIQGITLAGVFLDEVALMPRSFVEQSMARTLTFADAKIWFNCNPENRLHWFNQEWVEKADQKGAVHLHFLMQDNPILTDREIAKTESMFSGVFYDRYIRGLWVAAEGLIYDMFDEGVHVLHEEPDTEGDYYVSSDYGIQNATVFLLWRRIRGTDKWVILREWYYSGRDEKKQKTVSALVGGAKGMLDGIMPKRFIVDPSAAALIVELRKQGYKVQSADNAVLDGIADVGTMLNAQRLFVMDTCRDTINEFGVYAWDEKAADKGEDKPIKANDHAMDAVRYFVRTRKLVKKGGTDSYTPILG